MLLSVISPAKRLREKALSLDPALTSLEQLEPRFSREVATLVRAARKLKAAGLKQAMHISDDLATLNAERFKTFALPSAGEGMNHVPTAQPAIHLFQGDVYQGLDAENLSVDLQQRAQDSLRILSGLYGILRPFDLAQPYRLEMGTSIETPKGKTLYAYWGDKIADALDTDAGDLGSPAIVNLASQEYWGAVPAKTLKTPVVTCQFKEWRGDKLKIISFNAKRARGLMARYMIEHGVDQVAGLKDFAADDYAFSAEHSDDKTFVFTRVG